jgi:glutathione S-transferase
MSITFYYSPMSSATRVYWALEELGIPFEKVRVDLAKGEQRTPAYLAMNPNGKVPLLVVDGQPIFESLAQLLYLADTYGVDEGLYPPPGAARAQVLQWTCWGSVSLYEALVRLLRNTSDRFPAEEKNPSAAEGAKKELDGYLAILDGHLQGREWIGGETFSIADVALGALMPMLGRLGVDTGKYAALTAWAGRCLARPALARAMMG